MIAHAAGVPVEELLLPLFSTARSGWRARVDLAPTRIPSERRADPDDWGRIPEGGCMSSRAAGDLPSRRFRVLSFDEIQATEPLAPSR
jgi:hypothetical protein